MADNSNYLSENWKAIRMEVERSLTLSLEINDAWDRDNRAEWRSAENVQALVQQGFAVM